MHTRIIPSSGAALPVIGVGTYKGFDVGAGAAQRAALSEVLRTLFSFGGTVIDSSPMYGRAEGVVGDLLAAERSQAAPFIATKVWTQGRAAGIEQMRQSLKLMQRKSIDLMQVHNLLDWRVHLATLREWKAEGRIKYLGVTHYNSSAYGDLEQVMRGETLDFVQLNYSLDEREAERVLLPLAIDRGIAVLVNLPFGQGRLFGKLRGKQLPPWVEEIGCISWAQVLLKFAIAHPAVTCVIPGTGRPEHMAENCRAGTGPMLDESLRQKLIAYWDAGCR
ncbi:MAG: aldo/keto reductase [Acidobacteriia bacterium]|nr:aldo/keto reductase [Terriglobia bacterium]